jgi:hypothetical protein
MIVINNITNAIPGGILIGSIVLWYGSGSAVPFGYVICSGSSGSVDLRGKMILGANNAGDLLTTGGSSTHLHSGGGSDSASHNHSFSFTTSGENSYNLVNSGAGAATSYQHTHSDSGNTSDESHSHSQSGVSGLGSSIPLHKKLYWIQRIL